MILIFNGMILIFSTMILIFYGMILIFDLDQKIYDLLQLCSMYDVRIREGTQKSDKLRVGFVILYI